MSYILSSQLEHAIEVAIHLNKPLLLCGEPGTGKTTLAKHLALTYSVANPLPDTAPFYKEPLSFNTKTTSVATDLFYSYDALGRLRDAYAKSDKVVGDYIKLNALGKAIALTHGANALRKLDKIQMLSDISKNEDLPANPTSSIVLIDEIDKAPRDFPNDILNEIENHEFEIRELEAKFPTPMDSKAKIVILMTSNNEKNLPDAFLRRCIFHYIEFPDDVQLEKIIRTHFKLPEKDTKEKNNVMGIITTFNELRKQQLLKKPATAELIDWLSAIKKEGYFEAACEPYTQIPDDIKNQLQKHLGILLKNNIDMKHSREAIKNW